MLFSELLILSGPVTYFGCWVLILIILILIDLSYEFKIALVMYAILPIGAICQSGLGFILSVFGI